jgi:hypothetical protein
MAQACPGGGHRAQCGRGGGGAPVGDTDDKVRCDGRCQLLWVEKDALGKVEGTMTHRNGGATLAAEKRVVRR